MRRDPERGTLSQPSCAGARIVNESLNSIFVRAAGIDACQANPRPQVVVPRPRRPSYGVGDRRRIRAASEPQRAADALVIDATPARADPPLPSEISVVKTHAVDRQRS